MTATPSPSAAVPRPRGGNQSVLHSSLCSTVVDYLCLHGAWVYRVVGGLGGRRGCPDILAGMAPRWLLHESGTARLVAIEVKTGRGVLSRAQQQERRALEEAGALYVLVRSLENLEDALLEAGLISERVVWPRREGEIG